MRPFFVFSRQGGRVILIHQSDLAAWARCAAQYGYKRRGLPQKTNSAAAYGSVVHHALQVFERSRVLEGYDMALGKAIETFLFYWHPLNIEAITEPVPPDGWLPRQGYAEMRQRGVQTIRSYAELIRFDDHELMATEFGFVVPIIGTWDEEEGQPHRLGGSVDRLAVRHYLRQEAVCIDDYKTGKEYAYLRHNVQGTAYAYASTHLDFWVGAEGEDGFGADRGRQLYERFQNAGRRFTWINLRTFKFQDGGWRGPDDYTRFRVAVEQLVSSVRADIFPLTLTGEVCKYCEYRDSCAGVGVPADDHGKPTRR